MFTSLSSAVSRAARNMIAHAIHNYWSAIQSLRARMKHWVKHGCFRIEFDKHLHRCVDIWIAFQTPKGGLDAIKNAIDLIAQIDPISFSRLATFLPGGIAAASTNWASAWYNIASKRCYIGAKTIATYPSLDLATCIIHEMTHARLERFNLPDEATVIRIEKTCCRRELAFVRKAERMNIAHASDIASEIQAHLLDFPAHLYSLQHSRSKYRKEVLEKLRL